MNRFQVWRADAGCFFLSTEVNYLVRNKFAGNFSVDKRPLVLETSSTSTIPMWSDWWAGPSNGNGAVPRNGSLDRKRYESTGATLITRCKLVQIKQKLRIQWGCLSNLGAWSEGIILKVNQLHASRFLLGSSNYRCVTTHLSGSKI